MVIPDMRVIVVEDMEEQWTEESGIEIEVTEETWEVDMEVVMKETGIETEDMEDTEEWVEITEITIEIEDTVVKSEDTAET